MILLRKLRRKKNITMKQLGEMVGVSESAISQYENGKRQPDQPTLIKIADYFNVSTDYLLGRNEKNPAPSLTASELQLINNFRSLNGEGQEKLLDHSIDLVSSGRYIKSNESEMVSKNA